MDLICSDCPRKCGAKRSDRGAGGFCASPAAARVARAAPHFGEEPCISGSRGAGTIFFTGCNLRCVFCQNREISRGGGEGRTVSRDELRGMMLRLRDEGVHCIDLVTPTHFTPWILEALREPLPVPVVWNSSGYERAETLRALEGKVQVYLPDLKYADAASAAELSDAPDYFEAAKAAIDEMYRQVGPYRMGADGILQSGVVIRHMVLPGRLENTRRVIDYVAERFRPGEVLFSLMSQYTPMPGLERFPELQARISSETNDNLIAYMRRLGLEGYCQEPEAATEEMIPAFDGTGVAAPPQF